jgi:hypothetical protein
MLSKAESECVRVLQARMATLGKEVSLSHASPHFLTSDAIVISQTSPPSPPNCLEGEYGRIWAMLKGSTT